MQHSTQTLGSCVGLKTDLVFFISFFNYFTKSISKILIVMYTCSRKLGVYFNTCYGIPSGLFIQIHMCEG